MSLPPTITIPSRQDIIDAVDAGIKAAGDKLSEERVKNLRSYAQTTKGFTCGAWEYGRTKVPCPFAAVGGKKDDPGAKEFSQAYDKHITGIMGLDPNEVFTIHPGIRDVPPHILDHRQSYSDIVGFGGDSPGR